MKHWMHGGVRLAGLVAACCLIPSALVRAQDVAPPPMLPPNPDTNPTLNPEQFFGMQRAATFDLGWGGIGGSYYFQMRALLDIPIGPVGLGLQVPINLLSPLPTPAPADKKSAYGGVLRSQDWPKPNSAENIAQYLSLIRYIRYGTPDSPLYAQYGEFFDYTMGHGTIIEHYSNALDPDHLKPGLAFSINREGGGVALFTDNLVYPATNILAGRAYVRPFGLGKDPGFFGKRWAVGFTFAEDRTAPRLADGHSATIVGLDTEFRVFSNSIMQIIPYMDLNYELLQTNGGGLHIGVLGRFNFPVLNAVHLFAKLEYRLMQPTYIPNYFDAVYDMQRSAFPAGPMGTLVPKASAGTLIAPLGAEGMTNLKHGIYGEAAVDVLGWVQGGASFYTTPGVPNSSNLLLYATIPALSTIKISAYYLRSDFDSFSQIWQLDERSLIAAAVMYDLIGPLWLGATYDRHWVARYDNNDNVVGYEGVNDFNVGLQVYVPF